MGAVRFLGDSPQRERPQPPPERLPWSALGFAVFCLALGAASAVFGLAWAGVCR